MDAPIPLILDTLENLERFEKIRANSAAQVHAYGWAGLHSSQWFRSENSEPVNPIKLLPYPELLDDKDQKLSARTKRILVELIKAEKLPPHVADAATDLEEVLVLVEEVGSGKPH
jgi:hypothetical protein